ncbi:MAG: hypothetical protein QXZ13_04000 [Candidatus Diapherotrites archaeon]
MANTILYLINPENYLSGLLKIVSSLKGDVIIYVTANRSYYYLNDFFKSRGFNISKFFFIDCTGTTKEEEQEAPNCIFVNSPQNLTEISIAINELAEGVKGEKILLLDSLSTLLLYNDADVIGKFSHFFINKLHLSGISTIILALESDIDKDIIRRLESMSDEVNRA